LVLHADDYNDTRDLQLLVGAADSFPACSTVLKTLSSVITCEESSGTWLFSAQLLHEDDADDDAIVTDERPSHCFQGELASALLDGLGTDCWLAAGPNSTTSALLPYQNLAEPP
jgi:hypothetical protein